MTDRVWEANIKGNNHTIHLKHGIFSGKREIWLDGQQIVKDRNLVDYGSQHQFSIDGSSCELGITTNGLTFDYYLLLDGLPVEASGNKFKKKSKGTKTALSEVEYWRNLADISNLSYITVPNEQGFGRHRLIGYIRNYLVIVRFGYLPELGAATCVLVRFTPLTNIDIINSQVKAELLDKGITDKKHFINRYLDIQRDYAIYPLPYLPPKEAPEIISSRINLFIDTLSKDTHPLSKNVCEGIECKLRAGQDLHLVFTNGFPRFLCDSCIDDIPKLAKKDKEEYQKEPSGLFKGILAGIIAAIIGGILWAVVTVLLYRIAIVFSAIILIFLVVKVMDKAGTKRTPWSILIAGLIGMAGGVLSAYLSSVFYVLRNYPNHLPFEILQSAWQLLWKDKEVLSRSVFLGILWILLALWSTWSAQKQQLSQVIKPEVEILRDFPV